MSTDPDARIAAAVRAIADAPSITPPPPGAVRDRRAPLTRPVGWLAPALAAAAVLALAAAVALLPARGTPKPRPAAPTPAPATLPEDFAGMSLLTAPVSKAPPGPAVAIYSQGSLGTRRLGTSQVLVLGTDGRTYRRLDHAERSGTTADDGEWTAAPRRLSPDGTRVAVGDHRDAAHHIDIVDLVTGGVTTHHFEPAGAAYPVAWSPDGRRLLVATHFGSPNEPADGWLHLLDLDGDTTTSLGPIDAAAADGAFSPDGVFLARMRYEGREPWLPPVEPPVVQIQNGAGPPLRSLTLRNGQSLASGPAWSPDGRFLVLDDFGDDGYGLAFVDPLDTGDPLPARIPVRGDEPVSLLGWRDAETMLIGYKEGDHFKIAELSIHGGEPRVLSRISDGPAGLARPGVVQLATDLVATADVRDVGWRPDRGPWPWWWRITVGLLVLAAALVAWRLLRRRFT